ncbi:MAG: hydantoinase/oxoprolinase family protein [Armatimonadetes bacterium]|nr:hydantoinase/oxoprolinase family protein [Armatimonadota bacterium]
MADPAIRIGIDVGGTFTDAVAIDAGTHALLGSVKVPTTHAALTGVAEGIVQALGRLMADLALAPDAVRFIAHGTTQATNALLEGDVAAVGVVAVGDGLEGRRARGETAVPPIELAPGKLLTPLHTFVAPDQVADGVAQMVAAGAAVIVAAAAFSVDDPSAELAIAQAAAAAGLPAVCTHEMTQLLGLRKRTRTAVVNASILPRMVEAATRTEDSVRAAGIAAPLMVMRCDGGVMSVDQVRRRPVLTLLSGPAAGVAGALMAERLSDGLFLEVGGTSTDLSAVKGGRVRTGDAIVGGHPLAVPALDVRTVGVAGGSMVRVAGGRLVDVGPRSAHIAGLDYAAYADPAMLAGCTLETMAPRAGDPADYVLVRCANGMGLALTTTCAANALGSLPRESFAWAAPTAARLALAPLAAALGGEVDGIARQILAAAAAKVQPVAEALIGAAGLARRDVTLVAGGGGGAVIVAAVAEAMGLPWHLAAHHEVISPIGVALALVRESVERTIVPPVSEAALLDLRAAARDAAIASGAAAETVEVEVEVDAARNIARAVASGATELRTGGTRAALSDADLAAAAAGALHLASVRLAARCGRLSVYEGEEEVKALLGLLRRRRTRGGVLDADGVVRLRFEQAEVHAGTAGTALALLDALLPRLTTYDAGGAMPPAAHLLCGDRLVDLSGLGTAEQMLALARAELAQSPADAPAAVVAWARR